MRALWHVQPFGLKRDDFNSAQICSTVANFVGGFAGASKTWTPADFMLWLKAEKPKSVEDIDSANAALLAQRFGG